MVTVYYFEKESISIILAMHIETVESVQISTSKVLNVAWH